MTHNSNIFIFISAATFILTYSFEKVLLPLLKKKAEQPIYTEGPAWHRKKSGTPTMGGLAFLLSISIVLLFTGMLFSEMNRTAKVSLLLCLTYAALNSTVGIIDDIAKLRHKQNKGLSARSKLIFQSIYALLFLYARFSLLGENGIITFSFYEINLGILYYPITFFILVGITNCANLTDGIDGLAGCVSFASAISLFYISYSLSPEVSAIASSLIGAMLAFLLFNTHPAKIFMGDTGSLYLGALLASATISLGNPLITLFIGGVYVIEGVSVILQVASFKLTRKRIFLMAPIHHHLERRGWDENKICIAAILLTLLLSVPAFLLYLP